MTLDHPIKNAAVKVIQFVRDNNEINGPFFVHNSVDGIRRMNTYEFFEMLLRKHEHDIAVVKVTPIEFSGGANPLAEADMGTILKACTSQDTKYREEKVRAAFRTVWAAKTGEVMNI